MWKNSFSMGYLAQYFFFLPFRLLLPLLIGNFSPLMGFVHALKWIRPILDKRRDEKRAAKRRDGEVFLISKLGNGL